MRFFNKLFCFFISSFFFSSSVFSMEDEIVFELKREEKKNLKQEKKIRPIPKKFRRESFIYSKDFVVFNEKPKSDFKARNSFKS